jgi:cytochrome c biogenesis protein CcdA
LILCSTFSPLIFSKAQGNAKEETTLFFFYSPYCSSCQQAEPIVEKLEADGLAVEKYNIQDPGSLSLMMQLLVECDKAPSLAGQVPAFFYGDNAQIGFSDEDSLKAFLSGGSSKDSVTVSSLTEWGVFVAGLSDGLNPCTLNVLLILLAIIANKDRDRLLQCGLVFVFGVTSVYFLLGIGLGQLVVRFDFLRVAAPFIYILMGLLLVISSIGSNQGKGNKVKLKLGKVIGNLRARSIGLLSVFIIGLCSSMFEFICTGQIYLPTIYYISTKDTTGYLWRLVLYNAAFALPMVLIILLMFFGKNALIVQGQLKNQYLNTFARAITLSLGFYLFVTGLFGLFN